MPLHYRHGFHSRLADLNRLLRYFLGIYVSFISLWRSDYTFISNLIERSACSLWGFLWTSQVFPADCPHFKIVTAKNRFVASTWRCSEFPAYGKIYYRSYNDHVYSYDRHSRGLITVTITLTSNNAVIWPSRIGQVSPPILPLTSSQGKTAYQNGNILKVGKHNFVKLVVRK